MKIDDQIRSVETRLTALERERTDLLTELQKLRARRDEQKPSALLGRPTLMTAPESNDEKVELFLALFRGRKDIYPKRWENTKTGKNGYALVCENEWAKPICQKPKIKCGDCNHQKFTPLDAAAVESHLKGSTTSQTEANAREGACPRVRRVPKRPGQLIETFCF